MAAPQVGIQKRLIACGLHGELKILINPEILEKKGSYLNSEHCLSLPRHQRKMVKRSQYVKLKYKNLQNTDKTLVAKNSTAALLEHEVDHLNGILYIDH